MTRLVELPSQWRGACLRVSLLVECHVVRPWLEPGGPWNERVVTCVMVWSINDRDVELGTIGCVVENMTIRQWH